MSAGTLTPARAERRIFTTSGALIVRLLHMEGPGRIVQLYASPEGLSLLRIHTEGARVRRDLLPGVQPTIDLVEAENAYRAERGIIPLDVPAWMTSAELRRYVLRQAELAGCPR